MVLPLYLFVPSSSNAHIDVFRLRRLLKGPAETRDSAGNGCSGGACQDLSGVAIFYV